MKPINLESEFGRYLSSRVTAARLRARVESLANAGQIAFIDMTNVESMSESFADEAFAVLVAARGTEWFRRGVLLQGAKPSVRDSILNAVLERRTRAAVTPAVINTASEPLDPEIALNLRALEAELHTSRVQEVENANLDELVADSK